MITKSVSNQPSCRQWEMPGRKRLLKYTAFLWAPCPLLPRTPSGTDTTWQPSCAAAWPPGSWGLNQRPFVSTTSRGNKDSNAQGLSANTETTQRERELPVCQKLKGSLELLNSVGTSWAALSAFCSVIWIICWVYKFLSCPTPGAPCWTTTY